MTLNFDNYDVDIDVEATRRAHSRLPRTSEKCGCAGCRNFTLAIGDVLGEGGRRLFASVGVEDPAKATESCVDLPYGDGTFLYGAWYHLFGRVRRRFEAVPDATSAEWGEARERRVGERAHQLRGWAQNHREGGRLRGCRHRPDGAVSGGGPVGPGRAQPLPGRVGADFWPPPAPPHERGAGGDGIYLRRYSQFGLDGFPHEDRVRPVAEWRGRRVADGRYHLRGDMP